MERVKGIEPSSQAWEARILPLNHTRVLSVTLPFQFFLASLQITLGRTASAPRVIPAASAEVAGRLVSPVRRRAEASRAGVARRSFGAWLDGRVAPARPTICRRLGCRASRRIARR